MTSTHSTHETHDGTTASDVVHRAPAIERALVLGGGGLIGIAWEVGVLAGLADGGVDLTGPLQGSDGHRSPHAPELIVGTSAGSVVGALSGTHDVRMLCELALADSAADLINETVPVLDFGAMLECFAAWNSVTIPTPAALLPVCAIAAKTSTISEERFVASMTETTGERWPDARFCCTAVDTSTGIRRVWGEADGVSLGRAVASSCSVPSIFPAVSVTAADGSSSRYTDGGVHSASAIDVAHRAQRILVIAPIGTWDGDPLDVLGKTAIERETADVTATGSSVRTLFPDPAANEASLAQPLGRMDPARRAAALEHGRRQGRALADEIAEWW